MDLSNRVLGSQLAKQMAEKVSAVLLTIGRDHFTRKDLARIECFNFTAAANLSAILNRELQVKDTSDVFYNISPFDLALPRLGAVALAVLGACFELKRLGGEHPLENWVRNHTKTHKVEDVRTFDTIKHQRDKLEHAATTRGGKKARRPRVSSTERQSKAS